MVCLYGLHMILDWNGLSVLSTLDTGLEWFVCIVYTLYYTGMVCLYGLHLILDWNDLSFGLHLTLNWNGVSVWSALNT